MIMPMAEETNLILRWGCIKSLVQTSAMLDFLLGVKVIVMFSELSMNPKNVKDWVDVSTDFLLMPGGGKQ